MRQPGEERLEAEHADHLGATRWRRGQTKGAPTRGGDEAIRRTCSTKMTTPTAVMNPLRSARERTTSRKPMRKMPSRNVRIPTCAEGATQPSQRRRRRRGPRLPAGGSPGSQLWSRRRRRRGPARSRGPRGGGGRARRGLESRSRRPRCRRAGRAQPRPRPTAGCTSRGRRRRWPGPRRSTSRRWLWRWQAVAKVKQAGQQSCQRRAGAREATAATHA